MPTESLSKIEVEEKYQWLLKQFFFEDERDMGPGRRWVCIFYLPNHKFTDPNSAIEFAIRNKK